MQALVIDDSKTVRSILRKILGQIGFEVSEAGNGREGLQRLGELERPDLALVDWNMPEMDGLEFVRAVRADPRYAGLRLMMVTTENELTRVHTALEAGADEYVMKPFTDEVIREKLELLGIAPAG
jgi:two-component system chemotaxis response regulator CheY